LLALGAPGKLWAADSDKDGRQFVRRIYGLGTSAGNVTVANTRGRGEKTDDKGQKTEDGGQRSDGGQTEDAAVKWILAQTIASSRLSSESQS